MFDLRDHSTYYIYKTSGRSVSVYKDTSASHEFVNYF